MPNNVEEGIKRWSIPTSMVSGWLYNPESNLGLLLKSTSENTMIYKNSSVVKVQPTHSL